MSGMSVMHIKFEVGKNMIAVRIHNVVESDHATCIKIQNMLQSKRFVPQEKGWLRSHFDSSVKSESFEFWEEQVKKLCNKYPAPPDVVRHTPDADVMALITSLQEEIAELKKFDAIALSSLNDLKNKLDQS